MASGQRKRCWLPSDTFPFRCSFGISHNKRLQSYSAQLCNALHILLCLRGQSKHKIKLYLVPAAFKCLLAPFRITSSVSPLLMTSRSRWVAGLRCKGQAALFDVLHLAHNIQGKCIDPQGRQGDIYTFVLELINQEIYKLLQDLL